MKRHITLIAQLAALAIFVALTTEPPREGFLAIALLTLLSASLVCLWTAGMIQGKEKYESNPKSLKFDFLMMLVVSSGIMAFALFRTLG
jgi:phosphate/sulfate permease